MWKPVAALFVPHRRYLSSHESGLKSLGFLVSGESSLSLPLLLKTRIQG
jgi:hypothetical protein